MGECVLVVVVGSAFLLAAVEKLGDSHESRRKKRGALASEMVWRLTVIAAGVRVLSKTKAIQDAPSPRRRGSHIS